MDDYAGFSRGGMRFCMERSLYTDKRDAQNERIKNKGKKMNEKVSVIVPVYNAQEYLRMCIESILSQDYPNMELILIDDASTDSSRQICMEYAECNQNVKVMECRLGLAGKVRNIGMDAASGAYLMFVDADDYLQNARVLTDMVCEMEASASDIVVGNYSRLWKGKLLPAADHHAISRYLDDPGKFRFNGFFAVGHLSYVWGKLYRRSFLQKYHIKFRSYNYAEDKEFNFQCLVRGNANYSFVQEYIYVYRMNEQSVSLKFREDSCENWMAIADNLYAEMSRNGEERTYLDLCAFTIVYACFFDAKMVYDHSHGSLSAVKGLLKQYAAYPLAKHCMRKLACFRYLGNVPSVMWKVMLWGFSLLMQLHAYFILGFGIKLLVDLKIDQYLSDTGKREA